MEEEAWGITEEESWRNYGGIMEEVMDEVSWRRHHKEEQRRPGNQEATRRHQGGPWKTQEAPRGQGHLADKMFFFIFACAQK